MISYQLRKAGEKDMPAILDLVRELARYEKAPEEVTVTEEDYVQNFSQGVFDVIVAVDESTGKVIGLSLYYLTFSTWKGRMLYLEDFIVTESLRGHGVGKALFEATIQAAKDLNCTLMKWQVLDWNQPALNFYQKYDALIEKEWWNGKIIL